MTDRMRDEQLDREISNFLALRAEEIANAPSAAEMAARISSRVGTKTLGLRFTPQLVWVLLAGLLIAALIGAAVIGASLLRHRPLAGASNGWIAVSANPNSVGSGEAGDIYLVGQAAAARRIIGSDGDGVAQACPRFSPDGRRLAYGEGRASPQPGDDPNRGVASVADRAVVVVGLNDDGDTSSPITREAPPAGPGEIPCAEWSPDGRHIAFRVGPELWVADAASGETTVFRVAEAPWGQQGFEWSRDGSLIAVAEPGQIRVVPIDGGVSNVIAVEGATPGSLGWTAGDETIIYVSTDAPGDGLAVHVVDVDGSHDTRLTADTVADLQVKSSNVVVSPNGTRLAYVQTTSSCVNDGCSSGSSRVLTMDTNGSNVTLVPVPQDIGALLQWSPDGERLLFRSIAGVVSVAVAPGLPAIVHSSGELNLEWSGSEVTWQPVYP